MLENLSNKDSSKFHSGFIIRASVDTQAGNFMSLLATLMHQSFLQHKNGRAYGSPNMSGPSSRNVIKIYQ